MGWSIGWDNTWKRDIGYGVPALCDHPKCSKLIDRGLAYVCCDEEPHGGERGCGLYFCYEHVNHRHQCPRCEKGKPAYRNPKPDVKEWLEWKLNHPSWAKWRDEDDAEVAAVREAWATAPIGGVEFSDDELQEMGVRPSTRKA